MAVYCAIHSRTHAHAGAFRQLLWVRRRAEACAVAAHEALAAHQQQQAEERSTLVAALQVRYSTSWHVPFGVIGVVIRHWCSDMKG